MLLNGIPMGVSIPPKKFSVFFPQQNRTQGPTRTVITSLQKILNHNNQLPKKPASRVYFAARLWHSNALFMPAYNNFLQLTSTLKSLYDSAVNRWSEMTNVGNKRTHNPSVVSSNLNRESEPHRISRLHEITDKN